MAVVLLHSTFSFSAAAADRTTDSAISHFKNPAYTEKPMARMWFPDATAGMDDNDTIARQINALAAAGFGGVEVTMLADSSKYNNDEAAYCGWGTENWVKLLKKVFKTANAVKGGFRVDITITAHWPPTINTIDPNDASAATEISSSITKIKSDDLDKGTLMLDLPEIKTADGKNATFIFTDTYIASNIAKVIKVEDKKLVLDFNSMKKVSADPVVLNGIRDLTPYGYRNINGITYAGSPAGVPDMAYCVLRGWNYNDIISAFGPEQADPKETKKIDASGNRKRLADWQYKYNADISNVNLNGLNNDAQISAGDWVVVSTFYRGTGQVMSGGASIVMHNRPYVMNYFDESGIKVIYDYWWKNIIDDELLALLRANKGSIFEDSIESTASSAYWTYDLYNEFNKQYQAKGGYKYLDSVAALVASKNYSGGRGGGMPGGDMFGGGDMPGGGGPGGDMPSGGMPGGGQDGPVGDMSGGGMPGGGQGGPGGDIQGGGPGMSPQGGMPGGTGGAETKKTDGNTYTYSFDTANAATADLLTRIQEDYNSVMGKLYLEQHIQKSNEFAHSFGYTYRAQAGGIGGADSGAASLAVDVVETDAAGKQAVSAVYMKGDIIYSKEAMAGFTVYGYDWEDILIEMNSNFAFGYNRIILHGSAYSKSINGANGDWPGWPPFTASFGEPYSYRQIYWDRMSTVGNYIARNQAVLQNSTVKIDVAVLGSGRFTDTLLDNGYSYTSFSESLLHTGNSKVTNKQIYSEGVGYKALILSGVKTISVESMKKLQEFAENGLPIIFYNCNPSNVSGTDSEKSITEVKAISKKLQSGYSNVLSLNGSDDVLKSLRDVLGVKGYARYSIPNLETLMCRDKTDGTVYYYLFNNTTTNSMMPNANVGRKYKTRDIRDQWITLDGKGIPYILDAMTGDITQAGEYKDNGDGTISVYLKQLKGGESTIIAITNNKEQFPNSSKWVTSVSGNPGASEIVRDAKGNLMLRTQTAGNYNVKLSDGSARDVKVGKSLETLDLANADWNLVIDSYGPQYKNARTMFDPKTGIQTVDPSESKITRVDFGSQKLITWSDIKATQDQLTKMGVSNMNEVSGKGYYTTTFNWDGTKGADLTFVYQNDMVTAVTVNGIEIKTINNVTDTVAIGHYLVPGSNTIRIELSTTLNNRAKVESSTMKSLRVNKYGLTSVKIIPYALEIIK